ncbi:lovastatin nonaketide synthase [Penicillium verhagenii]|uniref:lovastatin nonaketide synthase n=1 Tax=Penicillium verhagenii TaxID=1562060 RepID=UPI0025455548|nr:lovastatin nonaketide synthase [Penicillium verhagenii]KAJ5919061.1 lovastatin nonaketide synthase [Penicillium verhagenii]
MATGGSEPIAIVGSGCRFPGGSSSPARLWELLSHPRDVSSNIPEDRFSWQSFYHPDGAHHGTTNTKRGYFLQDSIRDFDTKFFNIPPSEADTIDPQQRLLLEVVYEAMESAGMTLHGMQGTNTGVFVGMMGCDYDGMMALYLAVQALRNGDASVAVAAGVSLIIRPNNFIVLSNLNMVAPDGRSKMWDEEADGYARGEGVGVVILKPLSAALKDGDTIECVIREVCVNQDGRTQGITVPNGVAQADLIRQTYRRAGLDLDSELDRPQYFEAHGTGTPAGDPQEAQAIARAFFGENYAVSDSSPLYVGSIKTVIGHTEGAAGIAGILKASLALQHGYIPPNQYFNCLSSSVAPFAKNLEIPTSLLPWPSTSSGGIRRASVNSFGFGGSNAHAILEAFDPIPAQRTDAKIPLSPFTFSAPSEQSLRLALHRMAEYLTDNPETNIRDLAYTIQVRRSVFPFRTTFWALTASELSQKIKTEMENLKEGDATMGIRTLPSHSKKILGVFTGQGAQWMGMGKGLIEHLPYAQKLLSQLQQNLDTLPSADKPSWSLYDQLFAGPETSRLNETAISQPLITAIQIILVCLLRQAGVQFTAVVGHSSGEIAAAYAAGFLTAADAIRNAYYRGLFAKLAGGPNKEKGAMLAAGISLAEAKELCSHSRYKGRVMVAASNSPVSVTLSGDIDAIEELKVHLDEMQKFCRQLRVEAGYHSHHMLPIVPAYVHALGISGAEAMMPESGSPLWWSSVHPSPKPIELTEDLNIDYWKDNMIQSVLFNHAVENAVESAGPFDIALEIGPHPALRGPFLQTLNALSEREIPYLGCLARGKDDLETFSETLGSLWSHLGPSVINFDAYERSVAPEAPNRAFIRGLPSHSWTYDRPYWFKTRYAREKWHRKGAVHSLLGVDAGDKTETQVKWRNILHLKEMPWLENHRIYDQPIFPTTGYMCMAWEAALKISEGRSIQLFELFDLKIGHGILLDDTPAGVETIFTLTVVETPTDTIDVMRARFSCHSCTSDNDILVLNAEGEIKVTYGTSSASELPVIHSPLPNLVSTDTDEFYSSLNKLGYGYSGEFRSMISLERKRNHSRGVMRRVPTDLLIHPATLDTAFQAVLAATSYPGDGALWGVYTPVLVRHVSFNPYFATMGKEGDGFWGFDGTLMEAGATQNEGAVQVFPHGTSDAIFQMEGIIAKPSRPMTEANDRKIFSKIILEPLSFDDDLVLRKDGLSTENVELASLRERISYYYLRQIHLTLNTSGVTEPQIYRNGYMGHLEHVLEQFSSGLYACAQKQWVDDTKDDIIQAGKELSHVSDIRILHSMGERLLSEARGESTILDSRAKDEILEDHYRKGLVFSNLNNSLARIVKRLVHRLPQMHVLEIGSGAGDSTEVILQSLDDRFASFKTADSCPVLVDSARVKFERLTSKMKYCTLDLEADFATQGFQKHSFDLVIASDVAHGNISCEVVLSNIRNLLRPGGYLMLSGVIGNSSIESCSLVEKLTGFWIGLDEVQKLTPNNTEADWDEVLRKSGFSGVDTMTSLEGRFPYPMAIMISQAVDPRINFLREPLFCPDPYMGSPGSLGGLLIVGGRNLHTSKIVQRLSVILSTKFTRISALKSLEAVIQSPESIPSNVLFIGDLDQPTFKSITKPAFRGLKSMISAARNLLWVTSSSQTTEPYSKMSIGFGRSLVHEMSDLHLQFLDIDDPQAIDALYVSQLLLKLCAVTNWTEAGEIDDLVWKSEPEIHLRSGKEYIPRVVHDNCRNDRYNTRQRTVTHAVNSSNVPVHLELCDTSYKLQEQYSLALRSDSARTHEIEVLKSTFFAVNLPSLGSTYLAYGLIKGTSKAVIFPTRSNASILGVHEKDLFHLGASDSGTHMASNETLLEIVVWQLVADRILNESSPWGHILLYQPPRVLVSLLNHALLKTERKLFEIAHNPDSASVIQQIIIPSRGMVHHIKDLLPAQVSLFADFSSDGGLHGFSAHIRDLIPPKCQRLRADDIFVNAAELNDESWETMRKVLFSAIRNARGTLEMTHSTGGMDYRSAEECELQTPGITTQCIVDWATNPKVTVQIQPATAHVTFCTDKTYLLVGLTSDLGQSLCEWMVSRGARTIVLVSRNPQVEQSWLDAHKRKGANIHVHSADVTQRKQFREFCHRIIANLPPVAGVANAAMVLQDSLFTNTSVQMLNKVLAPKVDGSRNLDELFQDPGLDFFILFSSFGVVTGNAGQTSYNAANAYLTALAAQRQSRGLPASVMDLGPVLGLGYITRSGVFSAKEINDIGAYPISESDFLENFAEAVLASPITGDENFEIISGLRLVDPVVNPRISWAHNPLMSHLLVNSGKTAVDDGESKIASIKEQLIIANSVEQTQQIILDAFITRLSVILQLSVDNIDTQAPLIDLGVDSLVALDIRSWFLKSLGAEISLLDILSGSTVSEIANHAAENLPSDLLPDPVRSGPGAPSPLSVPCETDSSAGSTDSTSVSSSTEQIISNANDVILTPLGLSSPEDGFSTGYLDDKNSNLLDISPVESLDRTKLWSP